MERLLASEEDYLVRTFCNFPLFSDRSYAIRTRERDNSWVEKIGTQKIRQKSGSIQAHFSQVRKRIPTHLWVDVFLRKKRSNSRLLSLIQ